ncbi:hypothetical protein BDW71DRAFT_174847 [Aspergillus fruticulosus]
MLPSHLLFPVAASSHSAQRYQPRNYGIKMLPVTAEEHSTIIGWSDINVKGPSASARKSDIHTVQAPVVKLRDAQVVNSPIPYFARVLIG